MTKEEYAQLIKNSHAYKKMSADLQKSMANATGSLMLKYADILLDEQKMIIRAQQDYLKKNEFIASNLHIKLVKIKKNHLVKKEDASKKEDEKEEERLISQINNL